MRGAGDHAEGQRHQQLDQTAGCLVDHLTVILGHTQLLRRRVAAGEQRRLSIVEQQVREMSAEVDALLEAVDSLLRHRR